MKVITNPHDSRGRYHLCDSETSPALCGVYKEPDGRLVLVHRLKWSEIDRLVREWPDSHCYCLRCVKIMRAREELR